MMVAGKPVKESAAACNLSASYVMNVMSTATGKAARDRVQDLVDKEYADRMAAESTGQNPQTQSAIEVKEGELEAIQELRRIMLTSKSDQARAIAAKEILEISHLKQRLQTLAKPSGDESIQMSEKDGAALVAAIHDLQSIMTDSKPPAPKNIPAEPDSPDVDGGTPEGIAQSETDSPAVPDTQERVSQ